ncbi:hypothetical protein [Nocardioides terrisoli]|uniref:hypothetical protein n=1 Tax=Nocardioides terrisoli TaxID=3388267 RepID=UPI00287BB4A5|nr:hypothetical protein [Nocardioides marmorisolisilvae]
MAEPAAEDLVVRPFADWLREQSHGKTHDEMGDALYDLVSRVRDTGKKGTVSLTISVSLLDKDPEGPLLIADEIKLRLPEHDRKPSIFYADKDGNLTRTDPGQLSFESLREVPPPNVDPATGEIKEIKEIKA